MELSRYNIDITTEKAQNFALFKFFLLVDR